MLLYVFLFICAVKGNVLFFFFSLVIVPSVLHSYLFRRLLFKYFPCEAIENPHLGVADNCILKMSLSCLRTTGSYIGTATPLLLSRFRLIQSAEEIKFFSLPVVVKTKMRTCSRYLSTMLYALILSLQPSISVTSEQVLL